MPSPEADEPEIDRSRVLVGLVVLAAAVLAALVGLVLITEPVGRALMVGVLGFTGLRVFFSRSIRRN